MATPTTQQWGDKTEVLRLDVHVEKRDFQCMRAEDGVLEIRHGGGIEWLSVCSVQAATYPRATRATYALCRSLAVQDALARSSAAARVTNYGSHAA